MQYNRVRGLHTLVHRVHGAEYLPFDKFCAQSGTAFFMLVRRLFAMFAGGGGLFDTPPVEQHFIRVLKLDKRGKNKGSE